MYLTNRRRGVLLSFAAGAAVLGMASAAFACTQLVGTVTITATSEGVSKSATYEGDGGDENNPSKGFCTPPTRVEFKNSDPVLTFRLDVLRTSSCYEAVELDALPHQVRWINAVDDTVVHGNPARDCNTVSPKVENPWVVVGELPVNTTGTSSGTFALPATMRGPGNICVTTGSSPIAAPLVYMKWTVV